MTRLPILLTDVPLTKESILEETKNDSDLCRFYNYVEQKIEIIPEWGEDYEIFYENMHDVLPTYMVGFIGFPELNRYTDGVFKETALNLRQWLYSYLKKLLKRSSVWYVFIDMYDVPKDSSGMNIKEMDINELIANYDMVDYPKIERNIYYKFIDSESTK